MWRGHSCPRNLTMSKIVITDSDLARGVAPMANLGPLTGGV